MRIYFCRVLQLTAGSISTTVHVSSFSFYLLLVRLLPGAARVDPQHGTRAHEWHGEIQSAPASETSECESMSVLDGNAKGGAAGQRRCSTKFSIHLMRTAPQKYCERLPNWHENIDDDAHSIDSDSGKRWWWQRRGKWIMICIWGYEIRYSRYTRTGEYNVTIKFILPKYRWTKKKIQCDEQTRKGKKKLMALWWSARRDELPEMTSRALNIKLNCCKQWCVLTAHAIRMKGGCTCLLVRLHDEARQAPENHLHNIMISRVIFFSLIAQMCLST